MSELKYKVGDTVLIKSLFWYNFKKDETGNIFFSNTYFTPGHQIFCGKEMTIEKIDGYCYRMKEDNGKFCWSDEMITKNNNYKVGDKVLIKSNDWYETNKDEDGYIGDFCPQMSVYCGNVMTISKKVGDYYEMEEDMGDFENAKYLFTDDMIEISASEITDMVSDVEVDMGEVSDGYHTFNELYEYRLLYNASMFNELAKQGLYDVHKSKLHCDGKVPFDNPDYFIVVAELPTGQISNHYRMKDWDLFQIPEKKKSNEWDGHTSKDVAERLRKYLTPKPKYPTTYKDCCTVLNYNSNQDINMRGVTEDEDSMFKTYIFLKRCRDAYWKITGEEMGLGKPWEPDWNSDNNNVYTVCTFNGEVIKSSTAHRNAFLGFPTEEMRDCFYDAFKKEIKEVKEFL